MSELSPNMRIALTRLLNESRKGDVASWVELGAHHGHLDKRSVDALEWRGLVEVDRYRGIARLTNDGLARARAEMEALS